MDLKQNSRNWPAIYKNWDAFSGEKMTHSIWSFLVYVYKSSISWEQYHRPRGIVLPTMCRKYGNMCSWVGCSSMRKTHRKGLILDSSTEKWPFDATNLPLPSCLRRAYHQACDKPEVLEFSQGSHYQSIAYSKGYIKTSEEGLSTPKNLKELNHFTILARLGLLDPLPKFWHGCMMHIYILGQVFGTLAIQNLV